MHSLDAQYGDEAAFWTCVDDQNPSVLDEAEEPGQGGEELWNLSPGSSDTPTNATDPKADAEPWKRFLAAEAEWDSASWTCRSGVYNDHIDDVRLAVDQFAADNAPRIAQTHAEWRAVVEEAARLGYRGQSGSIDEQTR